MTLNTTNLGAMTPLPKVGSPFVFILVNAWFGLNAAEVPGHPPVVTDFVACVGCKAVYFAPVRPA